MKEKIIVKNIEMFNIYTKLMRFGAGTTAYPIVVSVAKTKNLRILRPYVEDFLKLRNEIIDKYNEKLSLDTENRETEMKKICEEEIIELGNIEFPEVEQLLSRIDLTVLPQDIPPSEYSLLENIINL